MIHAPNLLIPMHVFLLVILGFKLLEDVEMRKFITSIALRSLVFI